MAHAFLITGDLAHGTERALSHAEQVLGLTRHDPANLSVHRFVNFTIDDVRDFIQSAYAAPAGGDRRAIVLSASRLFHEAQNAMLKLFEEPPSGVTLYLVVPSDGVVLPTLRSRLVPLSQTQEESAAGHAFLALSAADQKKFLDKLYDRTKSDKQEEKRAARAEALALFQDLTRTLHGKGNAADTGLMEDLVFFTKTLHEPSAPLKPIFEHLLMVMPNMKASSRG